ncbi:MAG: DUF3772 domain-containing protein [Stappiaceae bacterium]
MFRAGYQAFAPLCLLLALFCAAMSSPVFGQTPEGTGSPDQTVNRVGPSNVERDTAQLKALLVRLQSIGAALNRAQITDEELGVLRDRTEKIDIEAAAIREARRQRIGWLSSVIQELTLPDETPVDETSDLHKQRQLLQDELTALSSISKQAEAISFTAQEMNSRISSLRRDIRTEHVLSRGPSILSPGLWATGLKQSASVFGSIDLLIGDWGKSLHNNFGLWGVTAVFASLVLVMILVWPVRYRLLDRLARDPFQEAPSNLNKSVSAAAICFLATVVPTIGFIALYESLNALDLTPPSIDKLLEAVFAGIVFFAFVQGLSQGLLASDRPNWRLLSLDDRSAKRSYRIVVLTGIVFGLGISVFGLFSLLVAEGDIVTLSDGIVSIILAILVGFLVRTTARGRIIPDADSPEQAADFLWRWLSPFLIIGAVISLLAPLIGYITLGWFVSLQLVWTIGVYSTLVLLLRLSDDGLLFLFSENTAFGRGFMQLVQAESRRIEQVGVVLSGIIRILLFAVAAILILAPWGLDTRDVFSMFRRALIGVNIGSINFSVFEILFAFLILALGFIITRAIQRWLQTRLLPRTKMDIGLKSSISTIVGYTGITLSFLIAVSAIGLNLQNIAIVAGALSVGVGFGLQSVVNNFVSGLILLAERPIKVGDWIVVGADQGFVRKINVRATEIETFDRASVIVPNSDLISGVVKNWMHYDDSGRIIIAVGVSYDSDPEQVQSVLLECAKDHERILAYPAPVVFFMDFGSSSLDFELRCFLSDVNYSMNVRSDLRFAIFKRLKEAGIEIPFPQRDIHLRDIGRIEEAMSRPARGNPGPHQGD